MKTILCIVGTRPEGIKMAPVVAKLKEVPDRARCVLCSTGQHSEMLRQVLDQFNLKVDVDLALMRENQTLSSLTARAVDALATTIKDVRPDVVLVQGDTSTAMVGALAAFYERIPVGHVEAGLRTGDKYNPFPEEINRRIISVVADHHFAPTQLAVDRLLAEGYEKERIHLTGNTVIDALLMTVERQRATPPERRFTRNGTRLILVTAHRRENFDAPLRSICSALRRIVDNNDVDLLYPVHMNPNVRGPVHELLGDHERIRLVPPLNYAEFVQALGESHLVLTDSGGVQEEAPALGKPVLVMRQTTERPEAVSAGVAELVGTDAETIVSRTQELLNSPAAYDRMARAVSPYGDGKAAARIVRCLLETTPPEPSR